MAEQEGEKSFAPTEKRKQDAAKNGDVLRSRDLATAVGVLVGAAWLKFAGPWLFDALQDTLRASFTLDRSAIEDFTPHKLLIGAMVAVLPPVFVLGGMILAASVFSQIGLSDGRWIAGNLAPKASRLNPLSGLKRMFGPQGWIELAKGLAKLILLGAIAYSWASGRIAELIGLGHGDIYGQLVLAWDTIISLAFALGAGLTVIALIDFPIQWVRRYLRLRMTLQEIKDESKEAEGSPEKKAAIRQKQRQFAMGAMQMSMKKAQFVITNPTHFSVAMAYDPDLAPAPVVLAKGRGEKALAMRQLAAEMGLPTLEIPPLARSVYFTTRENQMIREDLYAAVASVLAFVLSLGRGETPQLPAIDLPVHMRFDADGRPEAVVQLNTAARQPS
ncbi:EscU/YscU/HrcU family type III secretion system export apparatus switch protein [Novosphingobium sp. SL115]|uniref:EscU/YscU/HrcU family type III secretion system export apparatus switch protein n=1 Tax=Novosphingobium sp. SL115 TaxID=2995150 RepID=UPI002275CF5B|nr:EscU/YscU/HrcU family type III secretion system export apparatus switch protein [Novosphingobium sp. SL115]MCY1670032.1 EscU/YscU/HrcU family type III secretion system export apparatus switch protein [Novosphingobium sp. SL115]